MATVFRAPLIQRIERVPTPAALAAASEVWSNGLVALFGRGVATPFPPLDWITPPRRGARIADTGWENLLSTLLGAVVDDGAPWELMMVGVGR